MSATLPDFSRARWPFKRNYVDGVMYAALRLSQEDSVALLAEAESHLGEPHAVIADTYHITLAFKPKSAYLLQLLEEGLIGQSVGMRVVAWYQNDKVQTAQVEFVGEHAETLNRFLRTVPGSAAHITLSRTEGTSPFASNGLIKEGVSASTVVTDPIDTQLVLNVGGEEFVAEPTHKMLFRRMMLNYGKLLSLNVFSKTKAIIHKQICDSIRSGSGLWTKADQAVSYRLSRESDSCEAYVKALAEHKELRLG